MIDFCGSIVLKLFFLSSSLEVEKYRDLYNLHTAFNWRINFSGLISPTKTFDCDQNRELNLVLIHKYVFQYHPSVEK